MKKEKLIKLLNERVPDGAEIVLMDLCKNLVADYGEGSSEGLYVDFKVEYLDDEMIEEGSLPFCALIFNEE